MPAIALLAAIAGQLLAELSAIPECRGASLLLGRKPAFARTDLTPPNPTRLLVCEPALDVTLSHELGLRPASGQRERAPLRVPADRPRRARMYHLATELPDTPQRFLETVNLEVRQ
jgi:hypothetical protein